MSGCVSIRQDDQTTIIPIPNSLYSDLNLALASNHSYCTIDTNLAGSNLNRCNVAPHGEPPGAMHDYDPLYLRSNLLKQREPFGSNSMFIECKSGDVATWASQALYKPNLNRVGNHRKYDRDSLGLRKDSCDCGLGATWMTSGRNATNSFANACILLSSPPAYRLSILNSGLLSNPVGQDYRRMQRSVPAHRVYPPTLLENRPKD